MKHTALSVIFALALAIGAPAGAAKAGDKDHKVDVIVGYKDKPNAAETNRVKSLGGEVKREFRNFDMRVISISKNALNALEKGNGVKFVVADEPVESFSSSAKAESTNVRIL